MPVLRLVDGEKRFLLSLPGMWQHEWMFMRKTGVWHGEAMGAILPKAKVRR